MRFLPFLLIFFSCQNNSNNQASSTTQQIIKPAAVDTVSKIKRTNPDGSPKKLIPLFNNKQPFEIITVVDTLNMRTTDTDATKCGTWKLDKNAIKMIIQHAEPIDGTTWDLAFLVLKCSKLVFVKQHEQSYTIEMNAGSFFEVSNSDTIIRFGDFNKADRKYFLAGPGEE